MGEVSSVQVGNWPYCQADGNREPQKDSSHGGRPGMRPGLGQGHRDGEQGADGRAFEHDRSVVQWV